MNRTWQLQDAKNRFSEVVDEALKNGPQTVTRHGKEVVVIVSIEQFKKLTKPSQRLVDFMKKSPLRSVQLDLERQKDFPREVEL